MRLFELRRTVDESGVSGTGTVAQGVIFDGGWCVVCWLTEHRSVAVYENIDEVIAIHGHNGKTKVMQIADVDKKALDRRHANRAQDHCENIHCEFRDGSNAEYVWNEREKILDLFLERELS